MNDNDEKKLVLEKEDGSTVEAEIIFTHHSDKFNKDYVVFLPEDLDEYSAAVYKENEGGLEGELLPVESDEEWKMLEDLLNDYFKEDEIDED